VEPLLALWGIRVHSTTVRLCHLHRILLAAGGSHTKTTKIVTFAIWDKDKTTKIVMFTIHGKDKTTKILIAHETASSFNPPIHNFTGDRKTL